MFDFLINEISKKAVGQQFMVVFEIQPFFPNHRQYDAALLVIKKIKNENNHNKHTIEVEFDVCGVGEWCKIEYFYVFFGRACLYNKDGKKVEITDVHDASKLSKNDIDAIVAESDDAVWTFGAFMFQIKQEEWRYKLDKSKCKTKEQEKEAMRKNKSNKWRIICQRREHWMRTLRIGTWLLCGKDRSKFKSVFFAKCRELAFDCYMSEEIYDFDYDSYFDELELLFT
jgi:hypothetical protein